MKVRVTIMTENDKHTPDSYTDEEVQTEAERAWKMLLNMLTMISGTDKAYLEKCDIVER